MSGISICIVGAGSSYTPELIEGILKRSVDEMPIESIRLMDVNRERLDIMAGLSVRMLRHGGRDIELTSGTDLAEMLDGVDFVITQIRVGGMDGRYLDETIPPKYGMLGQETTGAGGMFKALRTIPQMLDIARTVERSAPDAFILNYTNPSGIITEAVTKHTNARIIGLCSGIPGIQKRLNEQLGPHYPDLKTYCVGLNHLGFVHRIVSAGKDVTREALERLYAADDSEWTDNAEMDLGKLALLVDAVPISYVNYFLRRSQRLQEVKNAGETRAQVVQQAENEVLAQAADDKTVTKPTALARRGGGGYSGVTFAFLSAIHNNTGEELPANVPNHGAVSGVDDDAVVEVICRVDRAGAMPLPVGEIPIAWRGLVQAVKAYETLTVEAAVKRSRKLVMQAAVNHPLMGDVDLCEPMIDEMLAAHGLQFQ